MHLGLIFRCNPHMPRRSAKKRPLLSAVNAEDRALWLRFRRFQSERVNLHVYILGPAEMAAALAAGWTAKFGVQAFAASLGVDSATTEANLARVMQATEVDCCLLAEASRERFGYRLGLQLEWPVVDRVKTVVIIHDERLSLLQKTARGDAMISASAPAIVSMAVPAELDRASTLHAFPEEGAIPVLPYRGGAQPSALKGGFRYGGQENRQASTEAACFSLWNQVRGAIWVWAALDANHQVLSMAARSLVAEARRWLGSLYPITIVGWNLPTSSSVKTVFLDGADVRMSLLGDSRLGLEPWMHDLVRYWRQSPPRLMLFTADDDGRSVIGPLGERLHPRFTDYLGPGSNPRPTMRRVLGGRSDDGVGFLLVAPDAFAPPTGCSLEWRGDRAQATHQVKTKDRTEKTVRVCRRPHGPGGPCYIDRGMLGHRPLSLLEKVPRQDPKRPNERAWARLTARGTF